MNFQKIHKPFFRIISFFAILHHILFPLYAGISHSVNVTGDGIIDYGEGGLGDEVMVSADSQYTCFTNLDNIDNAEERILDKDRFRKNLGGLMEGYSEVLRRIQTSIDFSIKDSLN